MAVLVLASALPVSSCWFGRKKALPPAIPPPMQLPADATPPQRIEEPPEIIPPELPAPPPPVEFPAPQPRTQQEEPAPPRRRVAAPGAQPEAPAPTPPAVAQPKAPQLAPLFSEEERRAYDAAIDSLISRTTQNIAQARNRTLSAEQKDMIGRAEAFLVQAREIRKVDPLAAKSLAERAELLSRHATGQ